MKTPLNRNQASVRSSRQTERGFASPAQGKLAQPGQSKALNPNDGDHNPEACPDHAMPYKPGAASLHLKLTGLMDGQVGGGRRRKVFISMSVSGELLR